MPHGLEPPRRTGLSARVVVVLLTIAYGLTGGGIAIYASWHDYLATVGNMERNTADLARLLEDHFGHALQSTELLLRGLAEDVHEDGLASLNGQGKRWAGALEALSSSPHLESLFVADPAGRLVATSAGTDGTVIDLSSQDYAAAIAGGARSFIGQVTKDRWSGAYAFPVAHRLIDPTGAYAGMAVAHVRVSFFKMLYHGLNLGAEPGLGVYRLDGAILVREPLPEADVGRNMSKNPVYTKYLPQAPIGTYHGKSAYDGVERIVAYRKVEARQLLVWVAMSLDDALQPWLLRLYRNAALAMLGLAMTIGLSLLALRALDRERQVKSEVIQSNQALHRANAELERFAEVAAHHLQEPLRTIASYAQLLQKRLDGHVKGDTAEFLDFLIAGSNDMKRLLHDLQRYTALQPGDPPATEVDLAAAASRAVAQLTPLVTASHADIVVGALPRVRGDAVQLQTLLRQLIENALVYRSPDRPPRITVSAERKGAMWAVSVRDNGIGIDTRFQERIFRVFERLQPRHHVPGTGIGLAICRKIVERHGGRIGCTTDQPEGTTFIFTLAA